MSVVEGAAQFGCEAAASASPELAIAVAVADGEVAAVAEEMAAATAKHCGSK